MRNTDCIPKAQLPIKELAKSVLIDLIVKELKKRPNYKHLPSGQLKAILVEIQSKRDRHASRN